MFAVYAESFSSDDPLSGLVVGERPAPEAPEGWATVTVKAASLNHHDLWSLRGVGLRQDALPMILGCDAAGLDEDGNEVVVHGVIGDPRWTGDEADDPGRSLLSERHQGTFADQVVVPRRNLVPKPASLSFEEAACLPTAWLTAYRMLFVQGDCKPGETVLVQGAGGGVATALITLGRAAGLTVLATSRDEAKRARALELGAHEVFESGARLPVKVDAVMETVGRATWDHSVRSLRPGGRIVISGTTSGPNLDDAQLTRIFFLQLSVIGSTMGTRQELDRLVRFLDATGARPLVDRTLPMEQAPRGLRGHGPGRRLRQDRLHPVKHVVTGAGSGIGLALAHRLADRGDELVLLARSDARAAELAATFPRAQLLVADLADPGTLNGIGRQVDGPVDSLVHVAGVVELAPVSRLRLADWEEQVAVNLTAPAVLTRELLPHVRGRPRHGRVRELLGRAQRRRRVVGLRRLQVRAAGPRRRAARRGGRARRAGEHRLPQPHRHPDAGEGPRAGGPHLRRVPLDQRRHGRRHDPARDRPSRRRDHPRRHGAPGGAASEDERADPAGSTRRARGSAGSRGRSGSPARRRRPPRPGSRRAPGPRGRCRGRTPGRCGSASRLSTHAGVEGWPKLVPSSASVPSYGVAMRWLVRGRPDLRPVVVRSRTASPASRLGALWRPRVARAARSSRCRRERENTQPPARVPAPHRTTRCAGLAVEWE